MNEQIRELAEQAKKYSMNQLNETGELHKYYDVYFEKFAELLKQAIYDRVKEELIPDEIIAQEPEQFREYLKGCNGGTVDALCHIKNFGVDIEL